MAGIIINILAVIFGGISGTLFGNKLSKDFTTKLTAVFGICAMGMGIASIIPMRNMPAVILSVVVGTSIGIMLHLEVWITKGSSMLQKLMVRVMKDNIGDTLKKWITYRCLLPQLYYFVPAAAAYMAA